MEDFSRACRQCVRENTEYGYKSAVEDFMKILDKIYSENPNGGAWQMCIGRIKEELRKL